MWIKNRTIPETLDILESISSVCAELGGQQTRDLFKLVKSKDFASILNYKFVYCQTPSDDEINDMLYARQVHALYSKLDCLEMGVDRSREAAIKFAYAEEKCRWTNRSLQYNRRKPNHLNDRVPSLSAILYRAQRKIAKILGHVPSAEKLNFSFGPGANTNVKSTLACPRAKMSVALECSHEMVPYLSAHLEEVPLWVSLHEVDGDEFISIVPVNVRPGKLQFVPKTALIDRTIMVEPILNSFFQKGIGSYMRERLLNKARVDLHDQTRNQGLAWEGSLTGDLATIDLSSASDCISYELVYELLPLHWAELLSNLRTGHVRIPDAYTSLFNESSVDEEGVLKLEKFSSMGNGFTFELESLIFYSLAHACCRQLHVSTEKLSVYGDDIIVPKAAYSLLVSVLECLGFEVNQNKSFHTGAFRESCGADYYAGKDIRPFYLKKVVCDRILYSMHNWFIRHGESKLADATFECISPSGQDELLWGPDGYGDGHLIGSYVLRRPRSTVRRGFEGGYFDTYTLRPRSYKGLMRGDSILPEYSVYTRSGRLDPTDPNIVRGSRGYAKISIYTLNRGVFTR
jgi:hypothetical protein